MLFSFLLDCTEIFHALNKQGVKRDGNDQIKKHSVSLKKEKVKRMTLLAASFLSRLSL